MAQLGPRQGREQRRLARIERTVSRARERRGREGYGRRVSKAQSRIPGCQRTPAAGSDRPRPEAVDQRTGNRRRHDRDRGEHPDNETGDAQTEAATIVEVDDLERQDGAVPEGVQEDPGLDEPQLTRETEAEA